MFLWARSEAAHRNIVDVQTPRIATVTPIDPPIIAACSFRIRVIRQLAYPSLELRLVFTGSVVPEAKIVQGVAEP